MISKQIIEYEVDKILSKGVFIHVKVFCHRTKQIYEEL